MDKIYLSMKMILKGLINITGGVNYIPLPLQTESHAFILHRQNPNIWQNEKKGPVA